MKSVKELTDLLENTIKESHLFLHFLCDNEMREFSGLAGAVNLWHSTSVAPDWSQNRSVVFHSHRPIFINSHSVLSKEFI